MRRIPVALVLVAVRVVVRGWVHGRSRGYRLLDGILYVARLAIALRPVLAPDVSPSSSFGRAWLDRVGLSRLAG
jgi:hypothetical protein